jgi:hypothetical protein
MAVNAKSKSRCRTLIIVFLVLVVVLASSLFVYVFVIDKNDGTIHVKSEVELRRAIDDVPFGESVTIIFDSDISVIGTIIIPVGRDITLTSNKGDNDFFKLFGPNDVTDIKVEGGGVLRLDGIIVTHENGVYGRGVDVISGATFIMYDGEISNNNIGYKYDGTGGGVYNDGVFEMYGGTISGNVAPSGGGGVCNRGSFMMSGGTISGNIAEEIYSGDGSWIVGSLGGGGVYVTGGSFSMSDGTISGNTAGVGGGVYIYGGGSFEMAGGLISGNVAGNGGGVYKNWGTFNVTGGVSSDNTADFNSDVYNVIYTTP